MKNRFASVAVLCELCVQRISLSRAAKLAKYRKARGLGCFLRRDDVCLGKISDL